MIHPSAIIHPSAKIADSAEIGPYAIIGEDTVIGQGTKISAHAVVEFAEIGDNCTIHSHAAVGTAPQDLKYRGEPTRIIIGSNVTVREFTTLNRGTTASGRTLIGSNCLLMAYSHVAHDSVIGNGVVMANVTTLGGHVVIGDNAFLGGVCAVHQFTRIGPYAMIGGGSMVAQDVIPFAMAQGDRARLVGLNLVGLKRRGFSPEKIREIKAAYRTLFMSNLPLEQALAQLDVPGSGAEVRQILDFIRSSKRGFVRHGRKNAAEEE